MNAPNLQDPLDPHLLSIIWPWSNFKVSGKGKEFELFPSSGLTLLV